MGESLMVRRRVGEEGLRIVNPCHVGARLRFDSTTRGRDGKLCASSRGNTEVSSVVRNHWA